MSKGPWEVVCIVSLGLTFPIADGSAAALVGMFMNYQISIFVSVRFEMFVAVAVLLGYVNYSVSSGLICERLHFFAGSIDIPRRKLQQTCRAPCWTPLLTSHLTVSSDRLRFCLTNGYTLF